MQALQRAGAYLIAVILLTSCSAEWHFEQACKKKPIYCLDNYVYDTIICRDSFYYHRVDTTKMVDTITIDTGGIQVRIIRDHDIIRTFIKQNPDTVRITKTFSKPPKIVYKYKQTWWWLLLIPLLLWLIYKK